MIAATTILLILDCYIREKAQAISSRKVFRTHGLHVYYGGGRMDEENHRVASDHHDARIETVCLEQRESCCTEPRKSVSFYSSNSSLLTKANVALISRSKAALLTQAKAALHTQAKAAW